MAKKPKVRIPNKDNPEGDEDVRFDAGTMYGSGDNDEDEEGQGDPDHDKDDQEGGDEDGGDDEGEGDQSEGEDQGEGEENEAERKSRERREDESRTEYNRRRRQMRRERRLRSREEDREENRALRQTVINLHTRLQELESGRDGDDLGRVRRAISGARATIQRAKDMIKKGTAEADGDLAANGTDLLTQATQDLAQFEIAEREMAEKVTKREAARKAPPRDDVDDGRGDDRQGREDAPRNDAPHPNVAKNFGIFCKRNPWFKMDGGDEQSRLAFELDAEVKADGYDPRSKEYWEELQDRVDEMRRSTKRKASTPPTGSRTGDPRPRDGEGDGDYTLSAERIQAMKDAGLWDDPKVRKRVKESYKRYDKNHAQRR
jgi:hypothetical protein